MMATSAAVPPALCLKRPPSSETDEVALLKKMRSSAEDRLTVESLMERQSEGLSSLAAAHRSFPCVWMNGSSPNRDAEGGEKSPNPPPPQLALPLETEGASTERSLSGPTAVHPLLKTVDQTTTPPRNPFEERPGLEHLFRSLHGGSTPSDSEASVQSAEPDQQAAEVCPECHKVFKRKVYLQRHMEREHWSTAKVFKCDDCSYETKHQSNLSVHRRTHTGERPYHCGCCGQRYTQGHLLKSHIRSRHAGNMELYNLDKKSDSTRGRKSLDLKHDGGMAGPKVDKISALLQAAANKNSPIMPPMPKFNNLLPPPHMSGFPYFNAGLRPMNGMNGMMNPVMSLANSLLGGPRFFTIGGMPPNTGMLPSPSAISSSAALASFTQSPLLHSSASEPLNFNKDDIKASMLSEALLKQQKVQAEDLSKKLSRDDLWDVKKEASSPAPPSPPRDMMPALSPVSTPMSEEGGKGDVDELYEEASHSPPATVPASCCPTERSSQCQHLRKLQSLRRNVFRMLSTFTPDLSEENGIQDDGDDVDELLHEVIFSNIDDFMSAKE